MLLAIAQLGADTDNEDCTILLADGILALLGRKGGVALQKLLGVDKGNLLGQERLNLRVCLADMVLGTQNGAVDTLHNLLKILHRAALLGHNTFPVPLVNIQRVEVVQLLVGTNGVHIGDDTVAVIHLVLGERHSLPLGKGVYHLGLSLGHILDREGYGALPTTQVVVHTESLQYEERRCHTAQTQFGRDAAQEEILDYLDCYLGLLKAKRGFIIVGYDELTHSFQLFTLYYFANIV